MSWYCIHISKFTVKCLGIAFILYFFPIDLKKAREIWLRTKLKYHLTSLNGGTVSASWMPKFTQTMRLIIFKHIDLINISWYLVVFIQHRVAVNPLNSFIFSGTCHTWYPRRRQNRRVRSEQSAELWPGEDTHFPGQDTPARMSSLAGLAGPARGLVPYGHQVLRTAV
jgi:hypothetical protein